MKQIYLNNTAQNSNPKGIEDAFKSDYLLFKREQSPKAIPQITPPLEVRGVGFGIGVKLPKGPPGRSRSPGVGSGLFPDHPPDGEEDRDASPLSFGREGPGVSQKRIHFIHTKQTFYNTQKQNLNFLQTLIFTNMKKQILFLAFFILAALASITDSYGQMTGSTITPYLNGTCTGTNDSPLNPRPGKAYDYGVTIGNGVTGVTNYYWWATKNPQFVDGTTSPTSPLTASMLTVGNGLLNTSSGYAQTSGGTQTISITWSPQLLANTLWQGPASTTIFPSPTFVAVMAQGACSNNIQVYEINPQPAFTVDISNIAAGAATAAGYGNTISSCVSQVVSAVYNSTSNEIDMDYGKNTLYFEVISANFVGSWTPTITIAGLNTAETASVTIYDSWTAAQAGGAGLQTLNYTGDGLQVGTVPLTAAGTVTNTTSGVSAWLAVTVDHNTYENILGARPITVSIGGMDTQGNFDLLANCNATTNVDTDDFATQDITPRPDIDDTIGDPVTPAPDTFIIKTP